MNNFFPLIFAMFSFLIYILLYGLAVDSENFITSLLVFFAALGWSTQILLTKDGNRLVYYSYISGIIILPLGLVLLPDTENFMWYLVIIGLYLIGVLGLRLYISSYTACKAIKE